MQISKSLLAISAVAFSLSAQMASGAALDSARIERLTGLKGTFSQEENVFKVSKPRYMFLHYWGKGNARMLAQGVEKALQAEAGGK